MEMDELVCDIQDKVNFEKGKREFVIDLMADKRIEIEEQKEFIKEMENHLLDMEEEYDMLMDGSIDEAYEYLMSQESCCCCNCEKE